MALVIKTAMQSAPSGAETLFRDALVSPGTLVLHDYSNRGTLDNFSILNGSPVRDLAREASIPLSIDNSAVVTALGTPELTEGRGLDRSQFAGTVPSGGVLGLDLGTALADYLNAEQPNSLFVFWARKASALAVGRILTAPASTGVGFNISINGSTSGGDTTTISPSFAGVAAGGSTSSDLVQIGLEFVAAGQPLNIYLNGGGNGQSGGNSTGFAAPTSDTMIGRFDGTASADIKLYRWFVEDLDVSGRQAIDIIQQDWDYCTGTGQYAGLPTKRPFIDAV